MSELPERPENTSVPPIDEQAAEVKRDIPPETHKTTANPQPKATQFSGNPNPEAVEDSTLRPRDDTPAILEKKPSTKQR